MVVVVVVPVVVVGTPLSAVLAGLPALGTSILFWEFLSFVSFG